MTTILFQPLREGVLVPTKAHPTDAAFDLFASHRIVLIPLEVAVIPLGFAALVPVGYRAQLRGRSGLAKLGVTVLGGVIDHGYTGEWTALLVWIAEPDQGELVFEVMDRIAQFTVDPVPDVAIEVVEDLPQTRRGTGGLGSSGQARCRVGESNLSRTSSGLTLRHGSLRGVEPIN